ncbi:hypothetical protein MK489_12680 [Myxococcota bacterium]|nr:hypothetical protein [Myxococcota bacterium]
MMDDELGSDPRELVFALCHELGNLLAAARLEAFLLRDGMSAEDLSRSSETFSRVAAQGGSLLAAVRPLLAPETTQSEWLEPVEVLERLKQSLDENCARRVRVDLPSAADLPQVSFHPEVLHHLLLTEVLSGLEEFPEDVHLTVSGRHVEKGVAFTVEPASAGASDPKTLAGVVLSRICARTIVEPRGGSLDVEHGPSGTRCSLIVATTETDV